MICMKLSYDEIIQGNIELHSKEAKFYDVIHHAIWNKWEQARIWKVLKFAISKISHNTFKAVDFGAGTGNVTEKLIKLGFCVTAIDICKPMCDILKIKNAKALKEGKLRILNTNIDETEINQKFDLVACYSILHHLPNYVYTLKKLAELVKYGGVLYIDREPVSQFDIGYLKRLLVLVCQGAKRFFHVIYLSGRKVPKFDYSKSDVNMNLNYELICETLGSADFTILKFCQYYAVETRFKTPLTFLHKAIVPINATMIIGKKIIAE